MSGFEDELRDVFGAEASELLARLGRALVTLERTPKGAARAELVGEIFRIAHTLKGAAATASRQDFVEVAHALETLLQALRDGRLEPGRALIEAGLAASDLLSAGAHQPVPADAARELVARLDGLAAKASAPQAPAPPPPKASAPRASKKSRATLLDALARNIDGFNKSRSAEAIGALRETVRQLAEKTPPLTTAWVVMGELLTVAETHDAERRPKLVEAAFLALDYLHADLAGAASDEEAEAVRQAIAAAAAPLARPEAGAAGASPRDALSVRVQVSVLDSLHYRIEELVAVKLRLDFARRQVEDAQASLAALRRSLPGAPQATLSLARTLEQVHGGLAQEVHRLDLLGQGLQDDIKEVRMVPVSLALEPLHRMVRDLAQSLGKEAALTLDGDAVRVDKRLLELIREPLTQLVRNAVAHGLERPGEREAAGKPRTGQVRLSVESRESQVFIEVADDGGGIDPERVREEAVRRGLIEAPAAAALSRRETLNLIFAPGFSTSREVTQVSGRGVGLDVVRENVGRLGGRIEFFTDSKGTRFVLVLPLTLAASHGLTVVAGRHAYCLPLHPVEEVLKVEPGALGRAQGRLALSWRHQAVTFARLDELLSGGSSTLPVADTHVVVLAHSDKRLALGVDGLLGQHEMVVKAPAAGTPPLRFVSGTTTLADGQLVTVLDPAALVEAAGSLHLELGAAKGQATVLVVDDSLTSRAMVASVLEPRGYRVLQAHDGESALSLLARERVDLVVSDVEMPGLDGLGLTRRIRAAAATAELPVLLLTSLETPEARARGAAAGANGYVVKGKFEPSGFLGQVADLVSR